MESAKNFQELQISGNRKKLDGFRLFDAERSQDMKNLNLIDRSNTESLESETKYDLRKSLAWDSAFFTSPGFLETEELLHAVNSWDSQKSSDTLGYEKHTLLPPESLDPEMKSRSDECDIRKSLAWDNAFFTNEGVLDPEELLILNKGLKKSEMHALPGIEELWMSSDSNYTIDSHGSSLASFEIELFEDMKASMHKSSKLSNSTTSNSKLRRGRDMPNVPSSKKLDYSSQIRAPTYRRQITNTNGSERTRKMASIARTMQLSNGSGNSNPTSSCKPPKIERINHIPKASSKRVSSLANQVKGDNKSVRSTTGRSLAMSLKSDLGNLGGGVLNSTPSLKLASMRSPYATNESRFLGSPSSQSDDTGKSSRKSSRRKIDSNHVNLAACGSFISTSLVYTTTNKTERESYHTHFLSMPKTSTSTDACSSDYFINSDASKSDLDVQSHDQSNVAHESQETVSPHQSSNKVLIANSVPSDVVRNTKPSGLRIPSPKIGFFDAEDSPVPIENVDRQCNSEAPNALSKVGIGIRNLTGDANKSRVGKLRYPQPLTETRSTKFFPRETRQSTMKSISAQTCRTANDLPCADNGNDCLENEKPETIVRHALILDPKSLKVQNRGAEESLRNNMVKESKEQVSVSANKFSQRDHEDARTHYPRYNLHMIHEDDKENVFRIGNEVDGLNAQVGAIDLNGDVVIELKAKNDPTYSHVSVTY
ncbi:Arginine decarboxylase 1-like protein [Quillaja saponaria]|uniref:Arginine decarboxylase 1-like protein n=1 Tax=Quillaja saponaria TaxID=32244 RepID=A0AAD7M5N6_QUISA|nr:Arginine decarboxylase 1-like protein [Quillaja saponaria]